MTFEHYTTVDAERLCFRHEIEITYKTGRIKTFVTNLGFIVPFILIREWFREKRSWLR